MSETASAPAPAPAAAPSPAVQPTPVTTTASEPDSPPAPAPGPTPVATTAVAVPEPTPAPESLALEPVPEPTPAPAAVPEPTPAPETVAPVAPAPGPISTTGAAVPEPTPASEIPAPVAPAVPTPAPVASSEMSPEKPKPEQVPVAASTAEVASTSASNSETPELESPLTKKFTEAEWKALKEFRVQLPDIFADAFPDNAKARNTPINIWGVNVDPNSPQTDVRVSVILVKFLRARNLSVRDTRDMLIGTLRWRESFNIKAALEEDFPQDIFGTLGHVFGRDKAGRPVVYNIYGGNQDLKAVFGDVQRFIRWRVALMERSVDLLDFTEIDQTLQIHDYEGVSLTSRDANSKAAAAEASNIFQSHYPELLYKKFFINVPTLLNWIFWAFKPLLSANTLAKMSVVGTGHHAIKKTLSEFIDVKELPKKYGGNADAF